MAAKISMSTSAAKAGSELKRKLGVFREDLFLSSDLSRTAMQAILMIVQSKHFGRAQSQN
jgi:hypothetical protein